MNILWWCWIFSAIFVISYANEWNRLKFPPDCDQTSCTYDLCWRTTVDMKEIEFRLSAKALDPYSWAAVGWNKKHGMNGASVVDCIGSKGGFIIQSSFNRAFGNIPLTKPDTGLSKTSGFQDKNRIYCNFTHSIKTPPEANPKLVQPLDKPYYILMAYGAANDKGKLKIHHKHPFISSNEINLVTPTLNESTRIKMDFNHIKKFKERPWLYVCHGVAMIAALILCIGLSNLISRNMQRDWDKEICGVPFWLQMHKILVLITACFFVFGMGFVFGQVKEIEITTHSILGYTTFAVFCANIILGLIRPTPQSDYRRFFNFLHAVCGHGVFLLAVASAFYGIQSDSVLLPNWVAYSIIIYAIIAILFHTTLQCLYKSDPSYKLLNERNTIYSFRTAAIVVYMAFSGCLFIFYLFFIIFYPPVLDGTSLLSFLEG